MRYLGSQPGGLLFRAIVATLLILIVVVQFLRYVDQVQIDTERASVQQTVRIVDSGMVVYFSQLIIKKQLEKIVEMDGGNPFPQLAPYGLIPGEYRGVTQSLQGTEGRPGWYYLVDSGEVIYRYRYQDKIDRFRLSLKFDDKNGNGTFEEAVDSIFALHLNRTMQ